jgi:CHAT domain-containing protein
VQKAKNMNFDAYGQKIYAELTRNPVRALRMAGNGLTLARRQTDLNGLAVMTLCEAHALRECGHFERSLASYDAAARLFRKTGKLPEAWRTVIGKLDALDQLGRYGQAEKAARSAARYFGQAKLNLWQAKIYANLGNIYLHQDRYGPARKYYSLAYSMLRKERPLDGHIAHFNEANIYLSTGQPVKAIQLLETCRHFFSDNKMTHLLARTHYNLGYAKYLTGSYQEALDHVSVARQYFQELRDTSFLASCLLDESELYLRLNQPKESIARARRARAKFSRLDMAYELAESESVLGLAYLRESRMALAIKHLGQAGKFFERKGNRIKCAELDTRIALAHLKSGDRKKAKASLTKAFTVFRKNKLYSRMLSTLVYDAGLSAEVDGKEFALQKLTSATPWIDRVRLPWVLFPYYRMLGRLEAELGIKNAESHLKTAIRLAESMRIQIPAEDLRISYFQDKLQPFDTLVNLYLDQETPAGTRDAFLFAERSRSRALLDLLEGSITFNSDSKEKLTAIADVTSTGSDPWGRSIGLTSARTIDEDREQQRILRSLRQMQRSSKIKTDRDIKVKELQRSLQTDQCLISYYFNEKRLHAFVLDHDGLFAYRDLGNEDKLLHAWQRLRFQLQRPAFDPSARSSDCDPHLQTLGSLLLSPMESRIRNRRLWTIVPHRWLHTLPFHCLKGNQGSFIEQHAFSYAPSSSVYLFCLKKDSSNRNVLLLGYGDESTPLVESEISEILRIHPEANVFTGKDANLDKLIQYGSRSSIIHVASHGKFHRERPLFSGILLSSGWVTVPQIYGLKLNGGLVCLSGCETGTLEVAEGDELLGLARGFLYSGASSLMVSLWRVSDLSTAALMGHFYAELEANLSTADAFRNAILKLRQDYPHPFHWGPFFLTGKPR